MPARRALSVLLALLGCAACADISPVGDPETLTPISNDPKQPVSNDVLRYLGEQELDGVLHRYRFVGGKLDDTKGGATLQLRAGQPGNGLLVGDAVILDGNTRFIFPSANGSWLKANTDFSLEVVLAPGQGPPPGLVFGKYCRGVSIELSTDGQSVTVAFRNDLAERSLSAPLSAGPHHVVLAVFPRSPPAETVFRGELYVDGVLGQKIDDPKFVFAMCDADLFIGGADGVTPVLSRVGYKGTLDEIAFYGTQLNAERVSAHARAFKTLTLGQPELKGQ